MKIKIVYVSILIFSLLSCKEVYYPDLNNNEKVLVVSGLITNKHEVYSVSLFWARSYGKHNSFEPVKNAQVYVVDSCLDKYFFYEGSNGLYYSDSTEFIPMVGKSYKLNILLDNGDRYESSYAELMPTDSFGGIIGQKIKKNLLEEDGDRTLIVPYEGIETSILIPSCNGAIPKYRFNIKLSVQYVLMETDPLSPLDYIYCWSSLRNPGKNVNITSNKYDVSISEPILHNLCFLPKDKGYWDLKNDYLCFVVNVEAYKLNDESYLFYQKAYEQLSDNNAIFDPIAIQLPSNIKCVSNNQKKVLGWFEVSSIVNHTFFVWEKSSSEVKCVYAPDFPIYLSEFGMTGIKPYFWYNNYINF